MNTYESIQRTKEFRLLVAIKDFDSAENRLEEYKAGLQDAIDSDADASEYGGADVVVYQELVEACENIMSNADSTLYVNEKEARKEIEKLQRSWTITIEDLESLGFKIIQK